MNIPLKYINLDHTEGQCVYSATNLTYTVHTSSIELLFYNVILILQVLLLKSVYDKYRSIK